MKNSLVRFVDMAVLRCKGFPVLLVGLIAFVPAHTFGWERDLCCHEVVVSTDSDGKILTTDIGQDYYYSFCQSYVAQLRRAVVRERLEANFCVDLGASLVNCQLPPKSVKRYSYLFHPYLSSMGTWLVNAKDACRAIRSLNSREETPRKVDGAILPDSEGRP